MQSSHQIQLIMNELVATQVHDPWNEQRIARLYPNLAFRLHNS